MERRWGVKTSMKAMKRGMHYIIIHRIGFFLPTVPSCLVGSTTGLSCCLVARNARTRFINSRSTLCDVFADVSKNSQPNDRANAAPSSLDTSRSYVLSHLFPTSTKMGLLRFTRSISCRNTSSRSNVDRDAIEYTRMNPWPSLQGVKFIINECCAHG